MQIVNVRELPNSIRKQLKKADPAVLKCTSQTTGGEQRYYIRGTNGETKVFACRRNKWKHIRSFG